jgi:tRNA-specific 2-thiouridylase
MSGGVDSSVAAAMMLEQGHEVIGVTLKLWRGPNGEAPTQGCCTVSDSEDARRVAAQLGIPYYVLDYTEDFNAGVVAPFIDSYRSGLTPNPCVECNRTVKFSRLLDQMAEFDCDVLVTGHYVRTMQDESGWHLLRGADRNKDQSYVLYMLGQEDLARSRFPVGEQDKATTRVIAGSLNLRTAVKTESQDICFVGTGNYRDFLRSNAPGIGEPGPIVDMDGEIVGTHNGVIDFTIGQRKGLGVSMGEPRFVTDINPATSTVTLGRRHDLEVAGCMVSDSVFVSRSPSQDEDVAVQVRYKSDALPARVRQIDGGRWEVIFLSPQGAVAPGQAAVFYSNDEVLGGGTITGTFR